MKTPHRLNRTKYWTAGKEEHEDIIINTTCQYFKKDREDVLSKSRRCDLIPPRHQITKFLYERTELSTSQVALIMGYKNHSSIYHSIKDVDNLMEIYPDYKKKFVLLKREILIRELDEGIPPRFAGEMHFVVNSIYKKIGIQFDRKLNKLNKLLKTMKAVDPEMNLHGTEIQQDVIQYIISKS